MKVQQQQAGPLYSPAFEHDNCGIGAVVDIQGRKSHATVDDALKIVEKLEHRAGKDAEGKTGDGVGILLQISHRFFAKAAAQCGFALGGGAGLWRGDVLLPPGRPCGEARPRRCSRSSWRRRVWSSWAGATVPVRPEMLGQKALDKMPWIEQAFVPPPGRRWPGAWTLTGGSISPAGCSSSPTTTPMCPPCPAGPSSTRACSWWASCGSSTPTCRTRTTSRPSPWSTPGSPPTPTPPGSGPTPTGSSLHNGEINTIRGNVDRMLAREETMHSPAAGTRTWTRCSRWSTWPGSDSAMLDNTLEFLVMSGMELPLAVMICIPEPWMNDSNMSRAKRDLYQYYATMMEPWDGPASILFSDGDLVGAVLDRNGLRPSRYYITDDGQLILSSEVGVLDIDPEHVREKIPAGAGQDAAGGHGGQGRVIDDEELKETYAARQPLRGVAGPQPGPAAGPAHSQQEGGQHPPGSSAPGSRRPSATPMRM